MFKIMNRECPACGRAPSDDSRPVCDACRELETALTTATPFDTRTQTAVEKFETSAQTLDAASIYLGNPELNPLVGPRAFDDQLLESTSTHEFRWGQFFHRHPAPLTLGTGFVILIGVIVLLAELNPRPDIPDHEIMYLGCLLLIPMSCAVFAAYGYFLYLIFTAPRQVVVGPEGLSWSTWLGARWADWKDITRFWRYDNIQILQSGEVTFWASNAQIEVHGQRRVWLDHSLTGFKELAAKIEHFCSPLLLAKRQSEFAAGRADFGAVALLPDRIALPGFSSGQLEKMHRKQFILWPYLTKWGYCNGSLVFMSDKECHVVRVEDISEYKLLMQMIGAISKTAPTSDLNLALAANLPIPPTYLRKE